MDFAVYKDTELMGNLIYNYNVSLSCQYRTQYTVTRCLYHISTRPYTEAHTTGLHYISNEFIFTCYYD